MNLPVCDHNQYVYFVIATLLTWLDVVMLELCLNGDGPDTGRLDSGESSCFFCDNDCLRNVWVFGSSVDVSGFRSLLLDEPILEDSLHVLEKVD